MGAGPEAQSLNNANRNVLGLEIQCPAASVFVLYSCPQSVCWGGPALGWVLFDRFKERRIFSIRLSSSIPLLTEMRHNSEGR